MAIRCIIIYQHQYKNVQYSLILCFISEIRSVIQTEETTINPDTTSVAARDITNEKQIKQDSVPKAGDSTNVVDNANDESSKDSIPRKELLLASVDSGNGGKITST